MSGRKANARPKRATTKSPATNSLNAAIRTLQQAHAVATVAERAATNGMVEAHVLADVLVAIVAMIQQGLDAIDKAEVRS